MPRPSLPIAGSSTFTRPIKEWINTINGKKSELDSLLGTDDLKKRAAAWWERAFLRVNARGSDSPAASRPVSEPGVVAALREIERLIESRGGHANLTPDFLLVVNNLLRETSEPSNISGAMRRLDIACDWFSADSFNELHAVEQAATVFLRLAEIGAFEEHNHLTSLLGASLFTMRDGFPPIIIPPEMGQSTRNAFDEAMRMNTRPMVELIAGAIEKALASSIEALTRG